MTMSVPLPPPRGHAPDAARQVRTTFAQSQPAASQPKAWDALIDTVDRYAHLATNHERAQQAPQAVRLYRQAVEAWHAREGRVGLPSDLRQAIEPRIRTYEARAAALEASIRGATPTSASLATDEAGPSSNHAALLARVLDTRVDTPPTVSFAAIAGCEPAKRQLLGAIRLPLLAPQLFARGRQPPGGILLYGPPGTGKTMLAKAAANMVKTTMFAIEAADVTDKYLGESEKFIKALFETARAHAPAIVFIDEIDALLGARRSDESDAVRRIKNQFFTAMQGFHSGQGGRVLVIGATNRPWDLDDGAVRRFEQRIHVPLPDLAARQAIFKNMLQNLGRQLTDADYAQFAASTAGYSGADVAAVVRAAAMLPLAPLIDARYVAPDAHGCYRASEADAPGSVAIDATEDLSHLDLYDDVCANDVRAAMARFRPSVQAATLQQFAAYEAPSMSQES